MLAGEGLSIRVLDMFTVKPIDRDAVLAAAADTGATSQLRTTMS